MDRFVGVILICLNTVAPSDCNEDTAADVLSNEVRSELDCTQGWQEVIGRSALRAEIGRSAYVKTLCHRLKVQDAPKTGAEP
jgi:hypothetical protein